MSDPTLLPLAGADFATEPGRRKPECFSNSAQWFQTLGGHCIFITNAYAFAMGYEWDEAKNRANLAKHGIPLDLVPLVFEGPVLSRRNDRHGEERWLAIGSLEGLVIAFAYTKRGDNIRIINARRANRHERERYLEVARSRSR